MKSLICFLAIGAVVTAIPRPRGPEGRIVGGKEVEPHSLPYQVGFMYTVPYGQLWCGGSLIHPQWILTAAHCLEDAESVFIFFGSHNIMVTGEEGSSKQFLGPDSYVIHKDYDTRLNRNDIALIRLPRPLKLNKSVQTIRLPNRSEARLPLDGLNLLTSGWGKVSDSKQTPKYYEVHCTTVAPDMSIVLNSVSLKTVPLETCANFHPYVTDKNVCTSGVGGHSTCDGDSGGPLVADFEAGRTLMGITSYGAQKCQSEQPAVFTKVGPYLDWISQNTGIEIVA